MEKTEAGAFTIDVPNDWAIQRDNFEGKFWFFPADKLKTSVKNISMPGEETMTRVWSDLGVSIDLNRRLNASNSSGIETPDGLSDEQIVAQWLKDTISFLQSGPSGEIISKKTMRFHGVPAFQIDVRQGLSGQVAYTRWSLYLTKDHIYNVRINGRALKDICEVEKVFDTIQFND